MGKQIIPAFVINLDRRTDRLQFMTRELGRAGIDWSRVSALDAQSASDQDIAREVRLTGHKIGMGRGSQCCAVTNFDIFRKLVASDAPAALILQDDVSLDPDLRLFLVDLDWLPEDIGLVQFEKFGRPASRRLAGPAIDCGRAGRSLHRLHSRTAGAGCYLIRRRAAETVLREKPLLDMPIDHFLFSPNVSPLFDRLGVAIVTPALAVQRMQDLSSDMSADRAGRRKGIPARLRRLWQETNRLPQQAWAYARGARMVEFNLPERLLRGPELGGD